MTIAMTKTGAADHTLDALRQEIDEIDRSLHARLIERGEIIDRLIAVKMRQGGGSAFRPAREAEMMRRLVENHRGILPLDTVEGIWRIIISTFTYVQAPYTVHADVSGGDVRMRDSCRFHFGFTVPLAVHPSPVAVVEAVASARGDLGLIRAGSANDAWWVGLGAPDAPKIIARLPFVERADHAAGLPLFVVAKPLADAAPHDVLLYAVTLRGVGGRPRLAGPVEIVEQVATGDGCDVLAAAPEAVTAEAVAMAFQMPGVADPAVAFVGSHAARYEVELGLAAAQ